MKQILLMIAVVALVDGCASTSKVVPNSPEATASIEAAIRKELKKPNGELTKADLEKVTRFVLANNKLTDASGLAGLTQLKTLNLAGNKLTDVSDLGGLMQLSYLHLSFNQLTDISALAGLIKLEYLALNANQIADEQLKYLAGLTELELLVLTNNSDLTKAQIAELQKALPKCNIQHNAKK